MSKHTFKKELMRDPFSTDTAIRRLVMQSPERVRELTLTAHAHTMLQNIAEMGDRGYTSSSYHFNYGSVTSIQSTSQKMKHLYTMGYLTRTETLCTTGGILYVYKIAEALRSES